MSVPFNPGDRIRLKANHTIEAAVVERVSGSEFWFKLAGASSLHASHYPEDWERVPHSMPTLEVGMVVQLGAEVIFLEDAVEVSDWERNSECITRVGRVEWIWERDEK